MVNVQRNEWSQDQNRNALKQSKKKKDKEEWELLNSITLQIDITFKDITQLYKFKIQCMENKIVFCGLKGFIFVGYILYTNS